MNSKLKSSKTPFAYLRFFLLTVFVLIFISTVFRVVILVYESKFQDSSFYVLTQINNKPFVVHYDKYSYKINTVEIPQKQFVQKNKFLTSLSTGIPIDASVSNNFLEYISLPSIFAYAFAPLKSNSIQGLNAVDLFKLWLMTVQINPTGKSTIRLNKTDSELTRQQAVYDAIKDSEIVNEKVSVEVMNASGIDGLGSKITVMLKNMGVNVVSVGTGKLQNKSVIINNREKTKTLKKLMNLLAIESADSKKIGIADITIQVGKDMEKKL